MRTPPSEHFVTSLTSKEPEEALAKKQEVIAKREMTKIIKELDCG